MSKIDTGDKELDEALLVETQLKDFIASLLEDDVEAEDIIEVLVESMNIATTREAISRLEAEYA